MKRDARFRFRSSRVAAGGVPPPPGNGLKGLDHPVGVVHAGSAEGVDSPDLAFGRGYRYFGVGARGDTLANHEPLAEPPAVRMTLPFGIRTISVSATRSNICAQPFPRCVLN